MKKATFYKAVISDDGKVEADRVIGYAEGDIGISRTGDYWYATHIPTGRALTLIILCRTRKAALVEAKRNIMIDEYFYEHVAEILASKEHADFIKFRDEQETKRHDD